MLQKEKSIKILSKTFLFDPPRIGKNPTTDLLNTCKALYELHNTNRIIIGAPNSQLK